MLKFLLDNGANPNSKNYVHGNAMEAAAHADNVSGLHILFSYGATLSPRSSFGNGGALQEAANVGNAGDRLPPSIAL